MAETRDVGIIPNKTFVWPESQESSDYEAVAHSAASRPRELISLFFQAISAAPHFVRVKAEETSHAIAVRWIRAKQGLRELGPHARDTVYWLGSIILETANKAILFAVEKIKEGGEAAQGSVQRLWIRAKGGFDNLSTPVRDAARRLGRIAITILKAIGVCFLFAAQSTLFSIGFICGIVLPEPVERATRRISEAWNRQSWLVRGLVCSGAVIAWPISLAAAAFFVGGKTGLACLPARVEGSEHLPDLRPGYVGISVSTGNVGMTQQVLDDSEVGACI